MSNEKFTPGEWEVSLKEVHEGIFDHLEYHIWKCGENKLIAWFETWDETRFAESKANAALISAAPKMYQRLKSVKTDLWALSVNPAISVQTKECIDIIIKNIEGDLKKARGEQ